MYCKFCGARNPDNAVSCNNCGKKLKIPKKDPGILRNAFIISFLFSGMGMAYLGNIKKGFSFLIITLLLNVLGFTISSIFSLFSIIMWVYGLYSTYQEFNL